MSDEKHERWQRDHQRKLVRLVAAVAPPPPPGTERVHAMLVRLADPARQVDISDYELGQLAGIAALEEVRAAVATLIEQRIITVLIDPGARNPGIAPCMVSCPNCGVLLQSIHRRALELAFQEHCATVHGYRETLDTTTPTRGTRH